MGIYKDIKDMQNKNPDDEYVVFYFYRKISALFSTVFVKLRFSANFVTFLSLLADFLVIYLMYLGQWVAAGILVNLAIVFDNSDGEVARYYIKNKMKAKGKYYGGYLDETLGAVGFTLVVFFAGYFMGVPEIGFLAMFGLFMTILSATVSQIEFPNKKEIAKKFESKITGKIKGRIGFSNGIQRLLVSITVIFASPILLLFFAILVNAFWLLKFWVYRNY